MGRVAISTATKTKWVHERYKRFSTGGRIGMLSLAFVFVVLASFRPVYTNDSAVQKPVEIPKIETQKELKPEVKETETRKELKPEVKAEVSYPIPHTDGSMERRNVLNLTNASRIADSESPLVENATLDAVAQAKAEDMAKNDYFSHVDPDGNKIFPSIREAGYAYTVAGENLAVSYEDAKDMEAGWMASEHHRDNILRPDFTDTGIGIATGTFEGYEGITYVVQLFGER